MSVELTDFDLGDALAGADVAEIDTLLAAGSIVRENLRLLKKSGQNLVGQCLAHQGTFYEEEHYPKGDVFDSESHAQYYYHAHRPDSGEHGHFHTFLRSGGMQRGTVPVPWKGKRPKGKDALSHIVAISMDRPGMPIGMFTTNRWVTDESFYSADDVALMIDRFVIEQSYPCLATNRCLTALIRLFKPQIVALLKRRDAVIADWKQSHPESDVFEDRNLEITSIADINIDQQIRDLEKIRKSRLA